MLPALKPRSPAGRYPRVYHPGAHWMPDRPVRRCPKCGHDSYLFRARKTVEEAAGTFVETKYRCRSCTHQWWDRVPAPPAPKKADEAA